MKRIAILTALLLAAVSSFGQAARVDIPLQTSGPNVPISGGPLPQALWVANAAAYLCTHPSTTLVACQAHPITTYTDSTGGTTCPTATPLVQLPGNTCTAATGTTANVGFWYGGGLFDYWIVSSYGAYGPFSGNSGGTSSGVSQILAGINVTISPTGGTGAVTINATGGGSSGGSIVSGANVVFTGDSLLVDDSQNTLGAQITATAATCASGGLCTITAPNTYAAGHWVYFNPSSFSPSCIIAHSLGYYGTGTALYQVLATNLSSSQFQVQTTCGTTTGTGGTIEDATYFMPILTAAQPAFSGANSVYVRNGVDKTSAYGGNTGLVCEQATNFNAMFGDLLPSVTGKPLYLLEEGGLNDIGTGASESALEGCFQSFWSQAHTAGVKVIQNLIPMYNSNNHTTTADMNTWLIAQGKSSSNASAGQYWDYAGVDMLAMGGFGNPATSVQVARISQAWDASIASPGTSGFTLSACNPASDCANLNESNTFQTSQYINTNSSTGTGADVGWYASLGYGGASIGSTPTPGVSYTDTGYLEWQTGSYGDTNAYALASHWMSDGHFADLLPGLRSLCWNPASGGETSLAAPVIGLSLDPSGNYLNVGSCATLGDYSIPLRASGLGGPATAPSGSCSLPGEWVLSQDGVATRCLSGTWTTFGGGGGGGVWGGITGTLSNQTDLQTALNGKQAAGNYLTALTGDCTATGPGAVAITCTKSGGTAFGTGAFATIANYLTIANAASTYAPIFTLTTTGTGGAATYSGNVLNIPQYAGGSGMVWPSVAGIPYWTSGTAWGGAYNSSTPIPANYLPAALSSSTSVNSTTIPASSTLATISGSPVSPNVACFSASTAIGPCTSANVQTAIGASVYDAYGAAAARQANLNLAPGTYANGDMCTYASSGTLLNCNTAVPTGGISSVTAGQLTIAGPSNTITGSIGFSTSGISSTIVERDTFNNINATTFTGALTGHASLDAALTGAAFTGPVEVQPPTAATNGTNQSSPTFGWRANAWSTTNSASEITDIDFQAIVTNTAGSPMLTWTLYPYAQSGLTPTYAVDLSRATAGIKLPVMTNELTTMASATGGAGFNLPHGTAPTAPVNGDCWTTTAGLYCYINGATVGPYGAILPPLTSGSVLFSNGSTIAQDNSNFFWDATNKRLGIGGMGPTAPLSIYNSNATTGLTTMQDLTVADSGGSGRVAKFSFQVGATNLRGGEILFGETGGGFNASQETIQPLLNEFRFTQTGAYPITWYTNGLERMRLDGNGNLGIGTTAPTWNLSVGASNQWGVDSNGTTHQASTAPTVSAGSVATYSTNAGGKITGLSAATSVTITFANSGWTNAAFCVANASTTLATNVYNSTQSNTAVTFTFPALTGSLFYHCDGN